MARTETRFGATSALGTTYTNLATIAGGTTGNILLAITNRTTSTAKLRAYIAASSWSSGEPTGADLVAAVAYDLPVAAGDVVQISGFIMNTGEKLIVRSDTASSLDVIASGVAIT